MFINERIVEKLYKLYLFMWAKGKIRIGRSCLQKYSLEEHNQSARSPCRTNLTRLGHSDSYAGVLQSTLMCQPLTTFGQGKLSFLDPH